MTVEIDSVQFSFWCATDGLLSVPRRNTAKTALCDFSAGCGSGRQKGRTMRVCYTGEVDATVIYAKVGDVYDPVDLPDLPSC